jgi:hypothetical protein
VAPVARSDNGGGLSRIAFTACLLLLAFFGVVRGASAAPAWVPSQVVSDTNFDSWEPAIGVSENQLAVPTWYGSKGAGDKAMAATREPGGGFSPVAEISAGGGYFPELGVDDSGDALVAWQFSESFEANHLIQVSERAAGGLWSAPVEVSDEKNEPFGAYLPKVAMNASGDAVVIWETCYAARENNRHFCEPDQKIEGFEKSYIRGAVKPAGGSWSGPMDIGIPNTGDAIKMQVAIDEAGNAMAVWEDELAIKASYYSVSSKDWSAPTQISEAGAKSGEPQIAFNGSGVATAVWHSQPEGGGAFRTRVATSSNGTTWSATQTISADGESAFEPQIAVAANGEAVALWKLLPGPPVRVQAARRSTGGTWSAPVFISSEESGANRPRIGIDAAGNATAVWVSEEATRLIAGSTQTPSGSWTSPVTVSAAGGNAGEPNIDIAPDGNGAAAWQWRASPEGSIQRIETAGIDATGPTLSNFAVPATAKARSAVPFSVTSNDLWTASPTTKWEFGDGGKAEGTSASHTYLSTGTFTVKATSTDGFGHSTTETGSVKIEPAPADTTETSVSCSPTSVLIGVSSACTATVTDSAGLPQGSLAGLEVTLESDHPGQFSPSTGKCTLTGNATTASCSVSYKSSTAGTANITAKFLGDSVHKSSTSSTFAIEVKLPADTTTTSVSCTPNPVSTGTTSQCTATVTDSAGSPQGSLAGIEVAFSSNNPSGDFTPANATCTLTGGAITASCQVGYASPDAGTDKLTAEFIGDSVHKSSTSSAYSLEVKLPPDNTTTSVSCTPNPVLVNSASVCTATVNDPAGSPQGSLSGIEVAFSSSHAGEFTATNHCNLGSGTSSATCQVSYKSSTPGNAEIAAEFKGNSTHKASTSPLYPLEVKLPADTTTTSVSCTPNPVVTGTGSQCTATVTDTAGSAQGELSGLEVTFSSDKPAGAFTPASSCALSVGTTVSSCHVSYDSPTAGINKITAEFKGDAVHKASVSTAFSLEVKLPPDPTSTSVSCTPTSVRVSTTTLCTATVTDLAGSPQGSLSGIEVAFGSGTPSGEFTPTSSCTLGGSATSASCQVSYKSPTAGTNSLSAEFKGNSVHEASTSAAFSLLVKPLADTTTTSLSCEPTQAIVDAATLCTATVTDSSGSPQGDLGGLEVVFESTNSSGHFTAPETCTLSSGAASASCQLSYTSTTIGTDKLTAEFQGNEDHKASKSSPYSLVVNPVPPDATSTSVSCTPSSLLVGATTQCTATVTDLAGSPGGDFGGLKVSFSSDVVVGKFTPAANCLLSAGLTSASCQVSYTSTAVGIDNLLAKFQGDSIHQASESAPVAVEFNAELSSGGGGGESPPPPPAPAAVGTASAARVASVTGRIAKFSLTCNRTGPCSGTLVLTGKIRRGGKLRSVQLGTAAYAIDSGGSKSVSVRLNATGVSMVKRTARLGLNATATLQGDGIVTRTVLLKSPPKRRPH